MWKRTTEQTYDDMLEILPPAAFTSLVFLVGEPLTHRDGLPVHEAFVKIGDRFYVNTTAMTVREFKSLRASDVVATVNRA